MGRRHHESPDEDRDKEEEDEEEMDFDEELEESERFDDDFQDGSDLRASQRAAAKRIGARRLIEQAREQRELSRSLADFDDYKV